MTALKDDALRAAFKREKPNRPHWPAEFDAAIRDPIIRAALIGYANQAAQIPAVVRKHQTPRPTLSRIVRARLDFKSLAAGEKPEPDDEPET